MKVLRVFFNSNQVIWIHGLKGEGNFPTTIEDDLGELLEGTSCIELTDSETIKAFMVSNSNSIEDGKLIIGEPCVIIEPEPPEPERDLAAEIDTLEARIKKLEENSIKV